MKIHVKLTKTYKHPPTINYNPFEIHQNPAESINIQQNPLKSHQHPEKTINKLQKNHDPPTSIITRPDPPKSHEQINKIY